MKKFLLFGSVALLFGMASCTKGENNYNAVYSLKPLNIITTIADGTTVASEGQYTFDLTMDNSGQYGEITGSNLSFNNNVVTFTTVSQSYQTDLYDCFFKNVESTDNMLSDATFLLTPYYYYPKFFGIDANYDYYGDVVVAQYTYNNAYRVRTFQPNTFYKGTTNTVYPYRGETLTFTTETIYYLLTLNVKESPNTATLTMCNAKFSGIEQEPIKKKIIAEGLSVEYSDGKIVVYNTEDIIPGIAESGEATPNPDYIFSKLYFETTNDILTTCNIQYTVKNVDSSTGALKATYEGEFTGAYVDTTNRFK